MSHLRELGMDLLEEKQFEKALAVFSEAVRRVPADHRSRMMAARCLSELGEKERAVTALHACAEGLLKRDYLLSAIAACKMALQLSLKGILGTTSIRDLSTISAMALPLPRRKRSTGGGAP